MKSIVSRLVALEEINKAKCDRKEIERLATTPILFISPWKLITNEINVTYYPRGRKNGAEWEMTVSMDEVLEIIDIVDSRCYADVSMGRCLEWLYLLHTGRQNGTGNNNISCHSDEEIERVTEQWKAEYPELLFLESEEGQELVRVLQKLPQEMFFSARKWINEFGGEQ